MEAAHNWRLAAILMSFIAGAPPIPSAASQTHQEA